jgi:hypothetical protein
MSPDDKARDSIVVIEDLPHHPKVVGLNPGPAGTGEEDGATNFLTQ